MPDISLSPIGDTAAVAALLWTVWRERGAKKILRRSNSEHGSKKPLLSRKWIEPIQHLDKQKGRP
jgi:hypothetical protein